MNINLLDVIMLTNLSYSIDKTTKDYEPNEKEEKVLFCKVVNYIKSIKNTQSGTECITVRTRDLKKLIIAVRGTDSVKDWIENLDIHEAKINDSKITFHSGFYNQYKSIKNKIYSVIDDFKNDGGEEIIFCGHSSGGAVASIMCHDVISDQKWIGKSKAVTFGCPVFTNEYGASWFVENIDQYFRCVNFLDPVPNIPELENIGYYHVIKAIILFKNGNIISPENAEKESKISWCRYFIDIIWHKINVEEHSEKKYMKLIKDHKILYKLWL